MAENKEELKSLLVQVKEDSVKVGLRHSIQKTKITASGPITPPIGRGNRRGKEAEEIRRWQEYTEEIYRKGLNDPAITMMVQFSSVDQSCPTLCNPMDCSMPGFPVHHQLLELTQTHVHPVSDAIQPSHPLSSPSPPALNLSQHQGLFK